MRKKLQQQQQQKIVQWNHQIFALMIVVLTNSFFLYSKFDDALSNTSFWFELKFFYCCVRLGKEKYTQRDKRFQLECLKPSMQTLWLDRERIPQTRLCSQSSTISLLWKTFTLQTKAKCFTFVRCCHCFEWLIYKKTSKLENGKHRMRFKLRFHRIYSPGKNQPASSICILLRTWWRFDSDCSIFHTFQRFRRKNQQTLKSRCISS